MRGDAPGLFFLFRNVRPLKRQMLASKVQHILCSACYPGTYCGYSFRIGAATIAASCGTPDHLIKTLGGWSSDTYQMYIRTPVTSIVHVTSQLVQWEVCYCELHGRVPQVSFATSSFAPSCTRRFPSACAGACGWVLDTPGYGGGFILQRLGLLAKHIVVLGTCDEFC